MRYNASLETATVQLILSDGQAFIPDKVMVTNGSGKGVLLRRAEHAQPDCSFTADMALQNASASKTLTFSFSKISTENFHFHLRKLRDLSVSRHD